MRDLLQHPQFPEFLALLKRVYQEQVTQPLQQGFSPPSNREAQENLAIQVAAVLNKREALDAVFAAIKRIEDRL
jgi:hypothetical protein